jgi:hypothetical protein
MTKNAAQIVPYHASYLPQPLAQLYAAFWNSEGQDVAAISAFALCVLSQMRQRRMILYFTVSQHLKSAMGRRQTLCSAV